MFTQTMDISTSGLMAQRARMTAIAGNLANITSTRNEKGELKPYEPRFVVFQEDETLGMNNAAGVRVAAVGRDTNLPPIRAFNPNHPDADKDGYVYLPRINMMTEFTNAIEASRSYEANLGAIEDFEINGQPNVKDYHVMSSLPGISHIGAGMIGGLRPRTGNAIAFPLVPVSPQKTDASAFKNMLLGSIQEVNSMQNKADIAVETLMTGGDIGTAEVLTAVQKADIAFKLMMQIRNKLITAYQEIQNIRV